MSTKQTYALFQNARQVIQASTACRETSLPVKVLPVPEAVSSECGMCLQIEPKDRQKFEHLLAGLNLNISYYESE